MLVGGVVVDNKVNFEFGRNTGIYATQERQELLMPVAGFALGEYGASSNIQCGKQGGGAVTYVIVSDSFHVPQAHGQHRLCAIQGLDLALFVHTQDKRVVGRVQIQAHNVAHLLYRERVGRELETAGAVWLQGKGLKHAMHRRLG